MGDEEHDPSVTILCNGKDEGSKKVELGKEHAGEVWTDVMGWRQGEVTIDEGELPGLLLLMKPSARGITHAGKGVGRMGKPEYQCGHC